MDLRHGLRELTAFAEHYPKRRLAISGPSIGEFTECASQGSPAPPQNRSRGPIFLSELWALLPLSVLPIETQMYTNVPMTLDFVCFPCPRKLPQECSPDLQKNPRTHKNIIGTPPPQIPNTPPPKRRNFMDMVFPAERTHFSRRP